MESNTAINLSKKIRALESSGFSSDEINEVLKQLGTANAAANNIQYGESMGSWILNFGLPSMVVFGTGALFYYLTGGEDEPAIIAEVGDNDAVNCDINNGSHFQEDGTLNFDEEATSNTGNNQGVNQYNDSSTKKSATGHDRDDTSRRSTDRPFRNPASYIPESDPEKDPILDNLFGEISQQWLKELLLLSNTMAADIKTIKEEITTLKSKGGEGRKGASGSSNSSTCKDSDIESIESAAVPAAPELDTEGYLAVLRRAFRVFLNCRQATAPTATATVSATSSGVVAEGEDKSMTSGDIANDEALKKGCQALSMYAKKVLDNPTQPRYRKIAMSNASFKNLVQPLKGHIEVLSAIGFIATVTATPCFEWTWYFDFSEEDKSKTATTVKRVGKPDVSGVKDILKECIRFLDICTTQGLSSLEKELDKFDVVPAVVDATKEVDDKIVSTSADSGETLLTVKETDADRSSSSSSSGSSSGREKHAGTDNEGVSDGTAKSLEKSSNATAESNSKAAEQSSACAVGKVSDTPSDEIPMSVAPPISAESPSLLFSDIMKFVAKPPA